MMDRRYLRVALIAVLAASLPACGSGGTSASAPSPTSVPPATSFVEYAVGFCAAFDSLFRAVGNPDTGSGSTLSKALDAAVLANDGATAAGVAATITTELEAGRTQAAYAGGWAPAAPTMAQLDRLLVAVEAMTAAKLAKAKGETNAPDPQAVFEQRGGLEAWSAMFAAYRAMAGDRPVGVKPCANVPISP